MKVSYFIFSFVVLGMLISCGNGEAETTENPGPVNEMDQSRYNLNPSDKSLYGTTDSINQDSLIGDSLSESDE